MKQTARLHVGSVEEMGKRFVDAWRRLERGEKVRETHLTFFDLETMMATLSPKRLALLKHVRRHPASSVSDLAKTLGRDYKRVHADVSALVQAGLIVRDELRAQQRQAEQPHVYHHRLVGARQRLPIQIHAAILQMAGDEYARLRVIPVRQRDSRVCGDTRSRRDAGHDLERDIPVRQRFDFLAAASEDEWVSAFQTHYPLALPCELHQQGIDRLLRHGVLPAALADVDAFGVRTGQLEDRRRDEIVIDDGIGVPEQPRRAQREQLGIPGPGADQIHRAALRRRSQWNRSQKSGAGIHRWEP